MVGFLLLLLIVCLIGLAVVQDCSNPADDDYPLSAREKEIAELERMVGL